MPDAWKTVLAQARAVPCGNVWESLPGDERARHCAQCNRHVYNLAALSPEDFDALQAENPERLCVVMARPPRRFLPLFAKPFAAIVSLVLLCQMAGAQEKQQPQLRRCQDYLYTPMAFPSQTQCLDETGKTVESGPWLRHAYDESRARQEGHSQETPGKP